MLKPKLEKIIEDLRCKGCYGYPETPKKKLVKAILTLLKENLPKDYDDNIENKDFDEDVIFGYRLCLKEIKEKLR